MHEDTVAPASVESEIATLRKQLSALSKEKEALIAQRQDVGKQIANLIRGIKSARTERDTLTDAVRLSKVERDKLNTAIRSKIGELKTIRGTVVETPSEPREDPRRLRREIERLEYMIETEALSFDKEQKLMKKIKEIKRRADAAGAVQAGTGKAREISHEIEKLKEVANAAHEKVQVAAKESQSRHESVVTTSKQIDELKTQEDALNKQIDEKKAAMTPIANQLDAKTAEVRKLREKLGIEKADEERSTGQQRKKKLSELRDEVYAKMKRGEKLTTDDILIMQSEKDD